MNKPIQRSGLPMLFFAAIALATSVGLVLLFATPLPDALLRSGGGRGSSTPEREQPAEPRPEPAEAPPPQEEPPADAPADQEPAVVETEPPNQPTVDPPADGLSHPDSHRVVTGDTLFDLAGRYWLDPYLWPVLLIANAETVEDPDFLRQGLVLSIPARPEPGVDSGGDQDATVQAIVDAHLEAYRRYRRLGDQSLARGRADGNLWLVQRGMMRVNKAHWVLYSGLRYDENLLDGATGIVSDEDLQTVRAYIARFGKRPGLQVPGSR